MDEATSSVVEAVAEFAAMLNAAVPNELGGGTFDHSPEEIGIHVMENYLAIRAALAAMPAASEQKPNRHKDCEICDGKGYIGGEEFPSSCPGLLTPAASEGEPVAWLYTHSGGTRIARGNRMKGFENDGYAETPLYAHPAPSDQEKRA